MNPRPSDDLQAPLPTRRPAVSVRALLLSFLLVPLNAHFIVGSTWLDGSFTGGFPLLDNTLTVIFFLALLNWGLRTWRPRWAMRTGELLTIYVLLGVSTSLIAVAWAFGGALAAVISFPFWFATPENRWDQLLWPNLPSWLTVGDRNVLEGFFAGRSTAYSWTVVRAWAAPALWWTSFVTALMWVCLCLNSIVRRRWSDEEKLPFPLVTVPTQLADERAGLLRDRLFWVGVLGCMLIEIWNQAARAIPALPSLSFYYDLSSQLAAMHPWNSIPHPEINLTPWAFGLIYLLPLDMALSLFFFDLLWNVEYVLSAWFGWRVAGTSSFPYGEQQSAGGLLAIVAAFLWLDRHHLRRALRSALGLSARLEGEDQEAFSYRIALLGALAGIIYLWWFLGRAGMSQWMAPSFLVLYFAIVLGLSRLRAQVGTPVHSIVGMMPDNLLANAVGTRALGARGLGLLGLLKPYLLSQDNNPAPIQLEALKMAEGGKMERRRIALALAFVVPCTLLCFFWASLHHGYRLGMATGEANNELYDATRWIFTDLDEKLRSPGGPDVGGSAAMGFGFVMTLVMMSLRLRFPSWPLHPAAFPICLSGYMEGLMVPLLVLWILRSLLLRYGGLHAHRRGLSVSIGLLVGTAVIKLGHALLAWTSQSQWFLP